MPLLALNFCPRFSVLSPVAEESTDETRKPRYAMKVLEITCEALASWADNRKFSCRKPVWLELQRQAQGKLRSELYSPLPAAEAQGILEARKLGIASLRLLPKMSGGGCVSAQALKQQCLATSAV